MVRGRALELFNMGKGLAPDNLEEKLVLSNLEATRYIQFAVFGTCGQYEKWNEASKLTNPVIFLCTCSAAIFNFLSLVAAELTKVEALTGCCMLGNRLKMVLLLFSLALFPSLVQLSPTE